MKLRHRFKRLTLWNKLGAIGAIASIIALPTWLALEVWSWIQPPERIVEIEDPFSGTPNRGEWRVHEFDLVRDEGAELRLGGCPGGNCLYFRLNDISEKDGAVVQRFTLGGDGLGVVVNPGGVEGRHMIGLRGGSMEFRLGTTELQGWIVLSTNSVLEICSELYDLRIRPLSVTAQALRLQLSIKTGTWNDGPMSEKCQWI